MSNPSSAKTVSYFIDGSDVTLPYRQHFLNLVNLVEGDPTEPFEGDLCFPHRCLNDPHGKGLRAFLARRNASLDQARDSAERKQHNLAWAAGLRGGRGARNALEVGFNAGCSASIMLFSNPDLRLTCVDIGAHAYTHRCAGFLSTEFGKDRLLVIIGDSRAVLPKLVEEQQKFDLIHIDGGHGLDAARSDLDRAAHLLSPGGTLVFDDTHENALRALVDSFAVRQDYTCLDLPRPCTHPFAHTAYAKRTGPSHP
jgi:predicted O-methyltransferase YrrM